MNKEIVGKNLLDKEPILTGKEPPKIIGITEKQYYEYEKLQQENEKLKEMINKAIEYIEDKWYSKNTNNINEVFSTSDWRICLLEILRGDNNDTNR